MKTEYETKDIKPEYESKAKTYTSPKGNCYTVPVEKVKDFEAAHGVDELWTVK